MSAEQSIQEVSISAFIQIDGSASLSQSIQQVAVAATSYNPTATQRFQTINVQAFEKLNVSAVISQAIQSLSASAVYYDIGINANIVQPIQSLSAIATYSYLGAGIVQQATQRLTAYSESMVITAPIPRNLVNDYRILRSVRNKGSR